MNHVKNVYVVNHSGSNILASTQCNDCCNLTERKFCKIWAFPEIKWENPVGCLDFQKMEMKESFDKEDYVH